MNTNLQKQIKRQVEKLENDDSCWLWTGQVSNSGRGRIKIKDESGEIRMVSAETASYLAFVGKIPEKHLVIQKCGERLCVNPTHLSTKPFEL